MLTSMTGFGRGTASGAGIEAVVEIRSVNSRYAEVSVRMPRLLAAHESEIQSAVKSRLERGRITVQIEVDRRGGAEPELTVDEDSATTYKQLLEELRDVTMIEEPVRLAHILQFSDVFTKPRQEEDLAEQQMEVVSAALSDALDAIIVMRRQEGAALADELQQRIDLLERLLSSVESRAPRRVEEARRRLRDRLTEVISDERISADRLEMEIALIADRLDITEECVRLRSHVALFREAIANDQAVGRKLNFISQEINREVNTIGSKSSDAEIAQNVVSMKEELEKIREQIQNVE
ncbi:MAG: YicC/YloC family endoribonuclease [Rhodothermales bacterium]